MVNSSPKSWKSGWDSIQESSFRLWYAKWVARIGLNPNPDNSKNKYDFREAYIRGYEPVWREDIQKFKWPDFVKSEDINQTGYERTRVNRGAKRW